MTGAAAVDVALVGAGGAASLVLLALAERRVPLRVAVIDPDPRTLPGSDTWDRTWCWWDRGGSLVADAVEESWRRLRVAGGDRPEQILDLHPMRYRLLRSSAMRSLVERRLTTAPALEVERLVTPAGRVRCDDRGAVLETGEGPLRATWVLDSRPAAPARPAGVSWVQSFLGWVLPAASADTGGVPTFMDFRCRQPLPGVAFVYVLPIPGRGTLVEYTVCSPSTLTQPAAEEALVHYLGVRGWHGAPDHVEYGHIPMTDAPADRLPGPRHVRIGTAGGATRPSSGFTFTAMHRQARDIAARLAAGTRPVPAPAYPERHRLMDALLLRGLEDGLVDGPAFFRRLFAANAPARVLDYLDAATTPAQDMRIMASVPWGPMIHASARWAAGRRRRAAGSPGPAAARRA